MPRNDRLCFAAVSRTADAFNDHVAIGQHIHHTHGKPRGDTVDYLWIQSLHVWCRWRILSLGKLPCDGKAAPLVGLVVVKNKLEMLASADDDLDEEVLPFRFAALLS